MIPDTVLVNGRAETRIATLDRSLHFGDGLFETIACRESRPRLLELHLERLAAGCARLRIEPGDLRDIEKEVRAVAQGTHSALIKMIVTRGDALSRGYGPSGREKATRITLRYPWPAESGRPMQDGVRVRICTLRLGENPALAGLKHCNRLEQVLARMEWSDPRIAEGLLFSRGGQLVSGTMSNVFVVSGSAIRTPRLDLFGVAGVMRRTVMRVAGEAGLTVEECALSEADLWRADEVFLTNARIGIWPVCELESRALSCGPVTRRLQQLLEPLLEGGVDV